MKEEGDVFKKFRDSFSRMEGHFHILEQRVPVELQMGISNARKTYGRKTGLPVPAIGG